MEVEVHFGKDWYHRQNDMIAWCHENLGDGGWLARPDNSWAVECAFGNTFFKFKNEQDAVLFALKWK